MKQDERRELESALLNLSSPLKLTFYEKKNDVFSQKMKDFVETVAEASAGKIEAKVCGGEDEGLLPGIPAIVLSAGEKGNIAYLAIPEGRELPPFLEALRFLSGNPAQLPADAQEALDKVTEPAKVWVLISAFCPNCPKVVEQVLALASSNPAVSAAIVDIDPFSQMAEAYGVKSVPATIIDEELVLIGQQSAKRLAGLLALRGTESFDGECIRALMETGRAFEAAKRICEGRGRTAILKLFQEPELSTRMGVLMVLEEALDLDAGAVREMVPSLIELLSHEDSRIRGDMADLLGKVGDPRAKPHLEKLTNDPDPDVVEAASDALEELN